PQSVARDLVKKPTRADGTEGPVSRSPVKRSAPPASVRRAPPAHGADTDDVLAEDLGLSADEIAALRKEGVVGNPD
ncbi:MAG: CoA transferase, partial [Pseudomonadota bacterium]